MLTKAAPKTLRWQRSKYSPLARQIDIFAAAGKFMFFCGGMDYCKIILLILEEFALIGWSILC
jgi:hypothetical protein